MPSVAAASAARLRSRDPMATTRACQQRCIAGMTLTVAIFAVPRTPQRTVVAIPVDAYNHSTKPIVLLALLAAPAAAGRPPATTAPQTGLRLVWADEFDHDGPPDPSNWSDERGFVRNQELQWYQPDNARV